MPISAISALDHRPEPYCTSGTSPTRRRPGRHVPRDVNPAFASQGARVHLLGPGQVGRELLGLLAHTPHRLVAVSDSRATLSDDSGLDTDAICELKRRGERLRDDPRAIAQPTADAVARVDADVVLDTTATSLDREGWCELVERVLRRGGRFITASKDALCRAAASWLAESTLEQLGINAVLGGTGRLLHEQLSELRRADASVALAGNASTTVIIEAIEAGASVDEGIALAAERGVLEPDPELDLRGLDAAVKLAIVAGALSGERVDPLTIEAEHLRALDPEVLRWRAARGQTTRLVGRWHRGEAPRLRYEALPRCSELAVPTDRVVYRYATADGRARIHVGKGLGALRTAQAALADLERLCPTPELVDPAQEGAR